MPETINNSTDHDNLVTLIETVKNLSESQTVFHREMKDSFKDLKDNYADRLNIVEREINNADKVFVAKAEHDKIDVAVDIRLSRVEKICYMGLGALTVLQFVFRFFVK